MSQATGSGNRKNRRVSIPKSVGRIVPAKGLIDFGDYEEDSKFSCALYIEKWQGLVYNIWNFQKLNDALYNGFPVHFFLNLPGGSKSRENRRDIEMCLIPLTKFKGMPDWRGIKNPTNYVMLVIPERMTLTIKMFDRVTRISRAFFKAKGFSRMEYLVLEHFLNAVIDPLGTHAKKLMKSGSRWANKR